jgi:hypothetical protein
MPWRLRKGTKGNKLVTIKLRELVMDWSIRGQLGDGDVHYHAAYTGETSVQHIQYYTVQLR